jgi:hypothetical protein
MRPKSTLLFFIVLLTTFNSLAQQSIEPFEARYHVYRGDTHVANSKLSLNKQNGEWVWFMNTEPRGIYSWLTKKQPFTETRMQNTPSGLQLLLENSGDYLDKPPQQSDWFDYTNRIIYHMKEGSISQIKLPDNVYNYQSVHTLYPQMLSQNKLQLSINFYRKGEITKSTLTLERDLPIPDKSGTIKVDKITQTFDQSDKQMIYYYQGESIAPLKIEQIKRGKDSSVMWRVGLK